ncbi:MAG: hypothetical protein JWN87_2445 [Frankiales bacterium]|nr:hypothetical protein [Frankiales bacterium]
MALLGVGLSGLLAAVSAAVLFARLVKDSVRPQLAAVLGAVFAVADVASGRTTFALGAATALAALVVLPRLRWAALLAVLTALLSPVAAAFLGFAAALLVLQRRPGGWTLGVAATVPVLVLAVLFPGGGTQPFSTDSGLAGIGVALVVAAVTSVPVVRTGALLYALAVLAFLNHDDPFGSNVLRLGLLVAAPLVLATARRSLPVVLVATAVCLWWQSNPTLGDLNDRPRVSYTALNAELQALGSRRAEVVATRDHRESYLVAEKVPLARGWARQIDLDRNPLFYDGSLSATTYRAWLLDHAVDMVAVPRRGVPLDFGSRAEADLVRTGGVAGLQEVWRDRDWTLYRVDGARPIAPAPATVIASGRTALVLRSAVPAEVPVEVRWSRWLTVDGPGCLQRDGDRVRVRFHAAGTMRLTSTLTPARHC